MSAQREYMIFTSDGNLVESFSTFAEAANVLMAGHKQGEDIALLVFNAEGECLTAVHPDGDTRKRLMDLRKGSDDTFS